MRVVPQENQSCYLLKEDRYKPSGGKAMQSWAQEELQGVQLGDARLNRRLVQIVDGRDPGSTAHSQHSPSQ